MERFTLQEVNVVEAEEWYQVRMQKGHIALENLDDVDMSSDWETVWVNINIQTYQSYKLIAEGLPMQILVDKERER